MKKALLFAAAAMVSGAAFAQPTLTPKNSTVAADTLWLKSEGGIAEIKAEINKFWVVKNVETKAITPCLSGLVNEDVVKTEAATGEIAWNAGWEAGQYKFSYENKAIKVAYERLKEGANWADFSLEWTGTKAGKGHPGNPFYADGDTLYGQFVDLKKGEYTVTMNAVSDKDLSLRIDLVDVNGRVGNNAGGSLYQTITAKGGDYEFKWNNDEANAESGLGTLPEDWYGESWRGQDNGRNKDVPKAPAMNPPFYKKQGTAVAGWCMLDMSKIGKIALTIDDAGKAKKDDKKNLWIKSITVGSGTTCAKLGKLGTVGLKGIAKKSIKAYAVANAIKVEGKAKVYNMIGQVVAEGAESIEVPCKGIYRVVNAQGAKTVVVK